VNENNDPDEGEQVRLLLRVVARCLDEDLDGTTVADAERPVGERAHELVQKFV
jgi:hypothetical protein